MYEAAPVLEFAAHHTSGEGPIRAATDGGRSRPGRTAHLLQEGGRGVRADRFRRLAEVKRQAAEANRKDLGRGLREIAAAGLRLATANLRLYRLIFGAEVARSQLCCSAASSTLASR